MGKVRKAMPQVKEKKSSKAKLSKFIQKSKDHSKQKRNNTYVFSGFYERLKAIDVKHAHSSLSFQTRVLDHLQDDEFGNNTQMGEEDDLTTSNFIQFLRAEKFKNRSYDFNRIFREIENLCFSYPLLILNKTKVVQKLLGFLDNQEVKSQHTVILDLCIALIKDLRHEIYNEFFHQLLPKAIEILDADNLATMDKIFQLLSFAFKFLLKPIKENIRDIFPVYIVLLEHKNRFIRKFSAQSFSYVLRKVTVNGPFLDFMLSFLDEEGAQVEDRINGLSELMFEVISGHGDDLHSKAESLLEQIYDSNKIVESVHCQKMTRMLLLKLVNSIDTGKLGSMFEQANSHLGKGDNAARLTLLLKIFNQSVALKLGRRIDMNSLVIITQALNNIVQKQQQMVRELPRETRTELAETLGLLYYFKFGNLMQIYQKSKLDFASAKTAFTTGVFTLESNDNDADCQVLRGFYSLLMQRADEITPKAAEDLNVEKILQIKQSQTTFTQFTDESHQKKARVLLQPLASNTLKMLVKQDNSKDRILAQIGLMVKLILISGENFIVQLPDKAFAGTKELIKGNLTDLQRYTLARFVNLTDKSQELGQLFELQNEDEEIHVGLKIDEIVENNVLLKNYGDQLDREALGSNINLVFDLHNRGYLSLLKTHTSIAVGQQSDLTPANCHDLLRLKQFVPPAKILSDSQNIHLFEALCTNLSKNSTELRIATLRVMTSLFQKVEFREAHDKATVQLEQIKKFYSGECQILQKLLDYENIRLAFETERTREQILRNIQVQIATGLVPDQYLLAVFHMMIGSLWLKYTPGHQPAMLLLQEIMMQRPELFMQKFLDLFEHVGHVTQFVNGATDNDVYEQFMSDHGTLQRSKPDQNIFSEIYLGDCISEQSYILVKDFHYNLCKTLQPIIDKILTSQTYKGCLFNLYDKFFEREYLFLNEGRAATADMTLSFEDALVQANMVDSEDFRAKRRMCYGKLCALTELLSKASALNKLSPPQTEKLIVHMTHMLNTPENSLQKHALACLLKCSKKTQGFNNTTVKLPAYQKLLEGLADDLKFRNMIPIINFGSSDAAPVNQSYLGQDQEFEGEELKKESKKNTKGSIPKLAPDDRLEVLPFIVKLLFSKLVKKKGAINKNNSIDDRRNIVYIFLSSLEPVTEFPLFFRELLEPLNLVELAGESELTDEEIRERLARVSFNQYASFINTVEIIFKQLGTLLSTHDFLSKLSRVLTMMLSLSKRFNGHMKEEMAEQEQGNERQGELYKYVGKQSKMCLRKGLRISKQLFQRFATNADFTHSFSSLLFNELIKDQLPALRDQYISQKSQMVEIITTGWSSQQTCLRAYLDFPDVLPQVLSMLQSTKIAPDNVQLIFAMLRNIVQATLSQDDVKKTQILNTELDVEVKLGGSDSDEKMSDESEEEQIALEESVNAIETARKILREQVEAIGTNLHLFWTTNQAKLRQAVNSNGGDRTTSKAFQVKQSKERSVQLQVVNSLAFVVSELSSYLKPSQSTEALSFLEIIISLVSNKTILSATSQNAGSFVSNRQSRNEDLLIFGCSAINGLLKNLFANQTAEEPIVTEALISRIMLLMLSMESRKARESFTEGLYSVMKTSSYLIRTEVLQAVQNMNTLKKGVVDQQLDYEKVLSALGGVANLVENGLNGPEICALLFNALNLIKCEEYAVRDYALHAAGKLIDIVPAKTLLSCEKWLFTQMKINTSELVLKSLLATLRLFITRCKTAPVHGCVANDLHPLLGQANEEDFFSQILSMQIQHRQKALRKLATTQKLINGASFRKAILPLVDYMIFDLKSHLQNRRNTVRYSREQTTQMLEDALNVYVSYSSRLNWAETFKLIRKLLYKIDRIQRNSWQFSGQEKEDEELEKTVTKSLCKVLEGLSLNEGIALPDAIELIDEQAKLREQMNNNKGYRHKNEFSDLLEELVGEAKKNGEDDEDMDEDDESGDDEKADKDENIQDAPMDVIAVDRKMKEEGLQLDFKKKIQMKLQRKVLPVLQRHLFDSSNKRAVDKKGNNKKPIRSFVAVAIAKIIRKLPIPLFRSQLQKLLNQIVTEGLRSSDVAIREKARKALVKVLGEVSPRFLQMIFHEMQSNLQRGFHLHVHLYTIHYLLNHLTGKTASGDQLKYKLEPGQITSQMIGDMSDILMSELFGDLMEQRTLTDTQKKTIKESKAQKAIPIFEVLTQFIDFKRSFLDLIAPVMRVLEQNPSFIRIQQCEELLSHISNKLLLNETLSGDQLLVFLFSIVERGIGMTVKTKVNDEKAQRDYGAKVTVIGRKKTKEQLKSEGHSIQVDWIKAGQQVSKKKTEEVCGRVLANFGLQCLKKALKQKGLIVIGDEHQQKALATIKVKEELKNKLDPFVVLFLRAFKTFYNPIIITTLHILVQVIHLGLPAFKHLMKKFLNRIFKLFDVSQSSDVEFLNTLFKCVTELIKTYSVYCDLSDTQIKTLVLIIKQNVTTFSMQSNVFHCLKSIINRRFLCPDLYDLMETIEEMMVTNISRTTRSVCANIFVQFILEYPLEPERVQQHINHMLKNLTYFDIDGRLQLLEVFLTFIEKFPTHLLDTYAELFFFTLFLRLVNDPAQKCREKVAIILKKLICKVSNHRQLLETVFKIGSQEEAGSAKLESLCSGKLQLLQLFAESGKLNSSDITRTVDFTSVIIEKHARIATKLAQRKAKEVEEIDELEINPANAEFLKGIDLGETSEEELALVEANQDGEEDAKWSEAYLTVSTLENLFASCEPAQVIGAFEESLGRDIVQLSWRHENFWVKFACQRILGHMFAICQQSSNFSQVFGEVFAQKENLLKLVYQMLSVFTSATMNEDLANQLVKNLTFLMGQLLQQCEIDDDTYIKVFKKASYIGRRITGDKTESMGVKLEAIVQFFMVSVKLFASQPSSANTVDNQLLRNTLVPILELVYRTYTDDKLEQNVRSISTEMIDHLSNSLDKSFFVNTLNGVQQAVQRSRVERKQKQKLLYGTQEGQHIKAKRRIAKTARKKEKKSEKLEKFIRKNPV